MQESYNFNNNAYRRFVETLKVRLKKKRKKKEEEKKRAVQRPVIGFFLITIGANISGLICVCLCVCVCRDHIGFHRPKWHSITRKIRHLAESISRITSTGAGKLNEHFAGTTNISIVLGPLERAKMKKERKKSCGLTKTPRPLPPLFPSPPRRLIFLCSLVARHSVLRKRDK